MNTDCAPPSCQPKYIVREKVKHTGISQIPFDQQLQTNATTISTSISYPNAFHIGCRTPARASVDRRLKVISIFDFRVQNKCVHTNGRWFLVPVLISLLRYVSYACVYNNIIQIIIIISNFPHLFSTAPIRRATDDLLPLHQCTPSTIRRKRIRSSLHVSQF